MRLFNDVSKNIIISMKRFQFQLKLYAFSENFFHSLSRLLLVAGSYHVVHKDLSKFIYICTTIYKKNNHIHKISDTIKNLIKFSMIIQSSK